jgi:hypothetical protein
MDDIQTCPKVSTWSGTTLAIICAIAGSRSRELAGRSGRGRVRCPARVGLDIGRLHATRSRLVSCHVHCPPVAWPMNARQHISGVWSVQANRHQQHASFCQLPRWSLATTRADSCRSGLLRRQVSTLRGAQQGNDIQACSFARVHGVCPDMPVCSAKCVFCLR